MARAEAAGELRVVLRRNTSVVVVMPDPTHEGNDGTVASTAIAPALPELMGRDECTCVKLLCSRACTVVVKKYVVTLLQSQKAVFVVTVTRVQKFSGNLQGLNGGFCA